MQAWQATVQDEQGNIIFNPSVTVYEADGLTLADIFDESGTPKPNPFIGTLEGFVQFWGEPGSYVVQAFGSGVETQLWYIDLGPVFASNAQAVAGTSDELFMNPANTRAAIDDRISSEVTPSITDLDSRMDSAEGRLDSVEAQADDADLRFQNAIGTPLVVLAEGQSNMRSVTDQTGGDTSVNPNVFAWNSQAAPMANGNAWVTAETGQNPFSGAAGINNLAFQFCKELQVRTGRPIYLILVALGGHSIEAFMNPVDLSNNGWNRPAGDADLFTFANDQIAAALPLVPGSPTSFDYFIWHQGEANKEDQVEVYAHKMRTMLKRFENIGFMERNKTDIITGELLVGAKNGRYRERHLSALQRLKIATRQDAFPRFKIARSRGLQPVTLIDDLHFSGEDLTAMGKRYVDAAFTENTLGEMDPTLMDLSVDSGLGWVTGNVASTTHNTYERREPFYLEDTPATIEDNAEIGWCYVSPSAGPTYFATRTLFRPHATALLSIDLELRNEHPTATGDFEIIGQQFNADKAFFGTGDTHTIAIPSGTTLRETVTLGFYGTGADCGFSILTRWFSVRFGINPDGTGPALRWNILSMRWL